MRQETAYLAKQGQPCKEKDDADECEGMGQCRHPRSVGSLQLISSCRALGFGFTLDPNQTLAGVCGVPQVEAKEPGTAFLAGHGPQITKPYPNPSGVCGGPQVEAEEPGTAYLAGQGPQIEDEDDPDEYEGEDQPESEDFEEGEEEAGAGNTPAGAPPLRPSSRRTVLGFAKSVGLPPVVGPPKSGR